MVPGRASIYDRSRRIRLRGGDLTVRRNRNFPKLRSGYLFSTIDRKKNALMEKDPSADVISLGVGDTTEPLTPPVAEALGAAAKGLGRAEGYSGYPEEQGLAELRERIAELYYPGLASADEIFVSDGAKCDIGRLQMMFGGAVSVAVQDPAYPVYVDGSVMMGVTGEYDPDKRHYDGISYLKCVPENDFFPDLEDTERCDLIYFCSPNNPTGATSTREQLERLVEFAGKNRSIIIFDSAYRDYIRREDLPRSIFEIDGAREVSLEVCSFSKSLGFTGVRLGWTVVPGELEFDGGDPVIEDWGRVMGTVFNGASNLVQEGVLNLLGEHGKKEIERTVDHYSENAGIIKDALDELGWENYGGHDSPYIWVRFPGRDSWDVFEELLEKAHIVTTPGSGFGPTGEGFLRFSAFGHREDVVEAVRRLREIDISTK